MRPDNNDGMSYIIPELCLPVTSYPYCIPHNFIHSTFPDFKCASPYHREFIEFIISFSVTLFFPYDHIHWKRGDATISSCIILPAAYLILINCRESFLSISTSLNFLTSCFYL